MECEGKILRKTELQPRFSCGFVSSASKEGICFEMRTHTRRPEKVSFILFSWWWWCLLFGSEAAGAAVGCMWRKIDGKKDTAVCDCI